MAKVVYKTKEKSVWLSYPETVLLLAGELGSGILDAFFPRKYPETRLTRRLFGLNTIKPGQTYLAKHRLVRQGLIVREDIGYRITPKGQAVIERLHGLFESSPKRWDGKWRLVIFDIPEKMKNHRDALRYMLANADYRRLQDSVWIGKDRISDEAVKLIEDCGLNECVYFFHLDDAEEINKYFENPSHN